MTDLDELRKLAETATPGPWRQSGGRYGLPAYHRAFPGFMGFGIGGNDVTPSGHHALVESSTDAAYIAATNPVTILRLLDLIQENPDDQ